MEINRELLMQKLRMADDVTIKNAVKVISEALGANSKQTSNAISNIDRYKQKVLNMTDRDIKNLVDKIGRDKVEEIYKQLNL